jgi:hypothetical protein
VLKETPSLASQLTWQSADLLDPVKRRLAESNQEAEDRETFNAFARENGFSECEANYRLAKTLGNGLSKYTLAQAVQSNALSLAEASPAELEKFRQDYLEQRQDYLINQASPTELRAAANQEAMQRRTEAKQQEADRNLRAAIVRDAGSGFSSLPDTWQGHKLDAAFIKNCSVETHKLLARRFGFAALDLRLRGLN